MTFQAGDKVKYAKMRDAAEILSGPHASQGGADRYLIEKADGNVSLVKVTELSELDGRREVVAAAIHQALYLRSLSKASRVSRSRVIELADAALAALDGIEKSSPLAKGDRIRITKHGLEFATVIVGDVLMVDNVDAYGDGTVFTTNAPRSTGMRDCWYFRHDSEGRGWERV
ncbi:hypothetical protein [Streptomyces sp. NRRL S-31]|uniref:hypothetical protein n=1 Tax=Streptomyces sp. NRRL S-31 TaxID=1463898 RepID=UPI0004C5BD89|nr:hypothetical protein [Streptomyces sp. NRRL S-31]